MEVQEQQGAEGVEQEATGDEGADQVVDQEAAAGSAEGEGGGEEQQPPSIEDIASRLGWVPKEKFRGDESKWKPADQFIIDGKEIQERQSRELKDIRSTLDTIKATSASIMEEKLRDQHQELQSRYEAAVAKGDPDEIWKVSQELGSVIDKRKNGNVVATRSAPAPETQEWVAKHPEVEKDPVAWERAVAVCDKYARAGYSAKEQLAKTEAIIRREFPHLFPATDEGKPPPSVGAPQSRNSGAPAKRGQTYADLPKEAKAIADDLVERGLIKDGEQYARNYFAQAMRGQ